MTTRVTFDSGRLQESTASSYKGMKAMALVSALLAALSWLPLSSAAEAEPFQEYRNGDCTSSSICTIDFSEMPGGTQLEITNVSCYLRTSGDPELHAMQLLVTTGTATRSALTLLPRHVDNLSGPFQSVYSANHSIFAFANAGQRFQAYVELKNGTFSQFACHISGDVEPPLEK